MDYSGMKVLVMGLGLNGGGLEAARYFFGKGALVTVTDLKDEKTLLPAIEALDAACGGAVRYVLGRHEISDFQNADITVKNPGARPDSPFLAAAKKIETDISVFLAGCPARVFAVTGTKGKSTASSSLFWILKNLKEENGSGRAFLGGNIGISPLSFAGGLNENDDVVLELSSFQLGDLRGRLAPSGGALLAPKVAVITTIMADHLDRYGTMEKYVADKKTIYQGQGQGDITVARDDAWGDIFLKESRARPLVLAESPLGEGVSGGWVTAGGPGFARIYGENSSGGDLAELVPEKPLVPGFHQKRNLLAAALAAYGAGEPASGIKRALAAFSGVEHRLEFFHEAGGARFYNDSAATVPEAAAAAVEALSGAEGGLVLVAGGTDKNLDFSPLAAAAKKASSVILLAGTGSDKLASALKAAKVPYKGPFASIGEAASEAARAARPGAAVALSPGAASFGMFANEFDRGRQWKEAVRNLPRN